MTEWREGKNFSTDSNTWNDFPVFLIDNESNWRGLHICHITPETSNLHVNKGSSTVYSQPTYPEHVFYSWIASGFWNCSIYRGIHQNIQSIGSWLISITSVVKRKKLSSSKFDYLTRKNFWANLWPSPGRHRKFGIIGFHTRFCAESKYRFSSRKL